jgi:acetyl esterase/lipase
MDSRSFRRRAFAFARGLGLVLATLSAGHQAVAAERARPIDVAYGPSARQHLDVYLPPHPEHAPILVMVHGGAWTVGNRNGPGVVENKLAHWGGRGWIFVSVGYRLLPESPPAEQAADVAKALATVQSLAPSWGGDPARVVLMGHSAGAHLVSLVAASPELARQAGAGPWLGTVAIDSAALDLTRLMRERHPHFYDRAFGSDPAAWRAASPTEQLAAGAAPMLLICSSQRLDDPCLQSRRFAARSAALGNRAEVLEQNLTHAQINAQLGLPGAYTDAVDTFIARLGRREAKRGDGP